MFTIAHLVQPDTIEEAYSILSNSKKNTILGGCAFLRLGSKRIDKAIDLSKLNLNYIEEQSEYIEIGAMATFRDIETNPVLNSHFNGVLAKSVSNVIGVQFRNTVTVGGTVYSRFGFSDLITALLALDTEVELYKGGRMSLETFMDNPGERDILTGIFLKKNKRRAVYQNLRNSASDYSILNAAVSNMDGEWRIVVGARPQRARIAKKASAGLSSAGTVSSESISYAAEMAAEELSFGNNLRGTAEYRKALCKVLVKRAVEVLQ